MLRSRSRSGARYRSCRKAAELVYWLRGLVALAPGTAVEAGLAVKKSPQRARRLAPYMEEKGDMEAAQQLTEDVQAVTADKTKYSDDGV